LLINTARSLRLILQALPIACWMLMAGCTESTAPRVAQPTTIVFKHFKLLGDPEPLAGLIAGFETQNPDLRVKDETLPSGTDEQHQFYAINLQAKSSDFDVFAMDVIWGAEFARAGWLLEMDDLLPTAEREQFFQGPIEAVTYRGALYGVPWFIDAGVLYYRKDLLAKYGASPPRTWDDLVRIAKQVIAKEPDLYGFVWQGKQYEGLVCNALEYLWSNGGDVLRNGTVVVNSTENRRALGFMRELIDTHGVTPPLVTTATEEPARRIFGAGKAVFLRNWPYAWTLFQQPGSAVQGRVGITRLPHFEGGRSAATLGGWQLAVNRFSKHPAAAERLVRFLTLPAGQKALAMAYGLNPTRKALYQDATLRAAQPALPVLYTVFEGARPRPVTPEYARISQVMQSEFSAVIAGIKAPGAALETAQHQIEDILRDAR